jgi:hypothetical protein
MGESVENKDQTLSVNDLSLTGQNVRMVKMRTKKVTFSEGGSNTNVSLKKKLAKYLKERVIVNSQFTRIIEKLQGDN